MKGIAVTQNMVEERGGCGWFDGPSWQASSFTHADAKSWRTRSGDSFNWVDQSPYVLLRPSDALKGVPVPESGTKAVLVVRPSPNDDPTQQFVLQGEVAEGAQSISEIRVRCAGGITTVVQLNNQETQLWVQARWDEQVGSQIADGEVELESEDTVICLETGEADSSPQFVLGLRPLDRASRSFYVAGLQELRGIDYAKCRIFEEVGFHGFADLRADLELLCVQNTGEIDRVNVVKWSSSQAFLTIHGKDCGTLKINRSSSYRIFRLRE